MPLQFSLFFDSSQGHWFYPKKPLISMSSTFMLHRSCFVPHGGKIPRIPTHGIGNSRNLCRFFVSSTMQNVPISQPKDSSRDLKKSMVTELDDSGSSKLDFRRLPPTDQDLETEHQRVFGRFIAREAVLDEEYWTVAWLRAESHWEGQPCGRYLDSYKRKFAEQVKKDERNVKRTVLNSVVGTLDISIRHLLQGETFPGERAKASVFSNIYRTDRHRYGYVANVCVAKFARRQGIASNMLYLAIEAAKSSGVKQVYVHVHKDNMPAKQLYEKIGFERVEVAMPHLLEEQNYLMSFKTDSSSKV